MVRTKALVRATAFLLIFFFLLILLQNRLTPKWDWPTEPGRIGKAVSGVYLEPKDTLDVLWLGTSHMHNAASPMVVYERQGIRSYNLATTGQPLLGSYLRLKSVLKTQTPKVVILDPGACLQGSSFHSNEASWRKLFDPLPLSYVAEKYEMSKAMVSLNPKTLDREDIYSGILPILRYHTNYKLEEVDFVDPHRDQIYFLKGQAIITTTVPAPGAYWAANAGTGGQIVERTAADEKNTAKMLKNLESNREALKMIADLCAAKGCELLLTKIPVNASRDDYTGYWDAEKHDLIQNMATEMGLRFIDLNYEDLGIDWSADTCDAGAHMNENGAVKVSAFFADWLADHYTFDGAPSRELTESWDRQLALHNEELKYYGLMMERDLSGYLDRVKAGGFTLFAAVSETIGDQWTEENQRLFSRVTGCQSDLRALHAASGGTAFACISSKGGLIAEKTGEKACTLEGSLEDGAPYAVKSAGAKAKGGSTISIDGTDHNTDGRGLQLVVYDETLKCVVDSITFDTQQGQTGKHGNKTFMGRFREALAEYEYQTLKH